MTTLFDMVKQASYEADRIGVKRSLSTVLIKTSTELGELGDEVLIEIGESYRKPGPDGIIGETVDTILCLLDLLHVLDPHITEHELTMIARTKGEKWIQKNLEMQQRQRIEGMRTKYVEVYKPAFDPINKVQMIKDLRDEFGCGLLRAKTAAEDSLWNLQVARNILHQEIMAELGP